jgi:hypothetical protein
MKKGLKKARIAAATHGSANKTLTVPLQRRVL